MRAGVSCAPDDARRVADRDEPELRGETPVLSTSTSCSHGFEPKLARRVVLVAALGRDEPRPTLHPGARRELNSPMGR